MRISYIFLYLAIIVQHIALFGLPSVNLGLTSFLDGGPLRPHPGFYAHEYLSSYYAHQFIDGDGHTTFGYPARTTLKFIQEYIYQFEQNFIPHAEVGIKALLPYSFYSHVAKNSLNIRDSGTGLGNLLLATYLQFDPIMHNNQAIFECRFEFSAAFPIGKDKSPKATINPGSNFIFLDPYWAFTLYFTERFATSWRIHYLWCGNNHKTGMKEGDALHANYTLEYWFSERWWAGINGYLLQQLHNDQLNGITVPKSRERIASVGVGALYSYTENTKFFTNLYIECGARNRSQGVTFVLYLLHIF